MIEWKLLRYLTHHPLNRRTRFHSLHNIARWEIAKKLLPGCEVIHPFVNDTKIIVTPGRWGSEANAYCGLHDFSDMGFLLHFLRPTDLFCDVGANVGEYTVLASAAIGARSLAFEPIQNAYVDLLKNIALNRSADRTDARCMAIGGEPGSLTLTLNQDTQNHVLVGKQEDTNTNVAVETDTLDNILGGAAPQLLKIDVEGWESEVLRGAPRTLDNPDLCAVIIELNGSGERYGYEDEAIHKKLMEQGFSPYHYLPFNRKLLDLDGKYNTGGNTLYVRNIEVVEERLRHAPTFAIRHFHI